jgi:hypothetical protein
LPCQLPKINGRHPTNISNVIVYIHDLLAHTKTHEDLLKVLEQVLDRLHSHNLKINLDKCFFGNKEVSYLGFTLTPEGIKPGKNKLKAIKNPKPPTDVKTIRSFVGLCNFFRTHIKNFAIIAAPLFKLTRKDFGYKGGPLPKEAMDAFCILQYPLTSEPVRLCQELIANMLSLPMLPLVPRTQLAA